jgi:hypothetical protein
MKIYIPYIAILVITYLAGAFIKMQFNPSYWGTAERCNMLAAASATMIIYPIIKFLINDMKQ